MKSKKMLSALKTLKELNNLFLNYLLNKAEEIPINKIKGIKPATVKLLHKVEIKEVKQLVDKNINDIVSMGVKKPQAKKIIVNVQKILENFRPTKKIDEDELSLELKEFGKKYAKLRKYIKNCLLDFDISEFNISEYSKDFMMLQNIAILAANNYLPVYDLADLKKKDIEYLSKEINISSIILKIFIVSLKHKLNAIVKPFNNKLSKIQIRERLLKNGYQTGADIIKQNPIKLGIETGIPESYISGIYRSIISDTAEVKEFGLYGPLQISVKGLFDDKKCCPPYEAAMWQDKYNYFTHDSALRKLMDSIKDNVSATTKQIISQRSYLFPLLKKYGLYDISNPIGNNVDTNKDIKYLQEANDVALTKQVVDDTLSNLRKELNAIKSEMKVNFIWVTIFTGSNITRTGGGDEDSIYLHIVDSNNNKFSIKPTDGLGFDDDETAWIELTDGFLPLNIFTSDGGLNLKKIKLNYTSGNGWLFEELRIKFEYEDQNPRIANLIPSSSFGSWGDDVVYDTASGWVENRCFVYPLASGINFSSGNCGVYSARNSNLNKVYQETKLIGNFFNDIADAIQEASDQNIFFQHYNDIIRHLTRAARHFLNQEFASARNQYNEIIELVKILLSKSNLLSFEKEFIFAIYVLIADTYIEEGNYGFAYSYYNKAHKYIIADNINYLWLKIANLFVKWGDSLYAQAGSNYEKRLLASTKYQKVANEDICLTYKDGCEYEVKQLWIDLGTVTANETENEMREWIKSLNVSFYNNYTNIAIPFVPAIDSILPVLKVEIIKTPNNLSQEGFIRLTFDVSEIESNRDKLQFIISNTRSNIVKWKPDWIRFHVGYEVYNPLVEKIRQNNDYYGPEKNVQVYEYQIEDPAHFIVRGEQLMQIIYIALWNFKLTFPSFSLSQLRPGIGCEYNYFIEYAKLRLDQISKHLNFLNIHDEYVPAHRFQELYKNAINLANRAVSMQLRYIDFKSRAENETLSLMDAAHIAETAQINLEISQERVEQANINLKASFAQLSASKSVVGQTREALDLYENTRLSWWERYNNATSAGYPGGISTNIGGGYSALTGEGYDEQFALQQHQYESELERAKAAERQAEFNFEISELELIISEKLVELESARLEFAKDRLSFLQNKEMNATYFYLIADLYKNLAENVIKSATRLAYIAERALEFEINQDVNVISMDYFQLRTRAGTNLNIGSELLLTDIEQLNQKLIDFRERFRDIPNIIEREFYFSRDFHEQFRILTSGEPSPDMIDVPDGLRRVEFTTSLEMYDRKIPGRYAFGRIQGVELEIQGDIGEGVVTGYLENARLVETEIEGENELIRHSFSLVRIPAPVPDEGYEECEPIILLKSDIPLFDKDFDGIIIDSEYKPLDESYWVKELEELLDGSIELYQGYLGQEYEDKFGWIIREDPNIGNIFGNIDPIPDFILSNSVIHKEIFLLKGLAPYSIDDNRTKTLVKKADRAGIGIDYLKTISQLVGTDVKKSVEAVNRYLKSQELPFVIKEEDVSILEKIKKIKTGFTKKDYQNTIGTCLLKKASKGWMRYRYGWDVANSTILYKDLTRGYSSNSREFHYIDDYVDYKDHSPKYVLRIKHHDADRQTLSTYNRKEDAVVFNPYNSQDMLGVFENTGIHMDWNLTLIAKTNDRNNPRFVYDKIREIILRVWYHAANERHEGPKLADLVEKSVMKLNNLTIAISFYRDFYDEFITLIGDYSDDAPNAMNEIRKYTDVSHPSNIPDEDGWIRFDINENLIQFDDRKIKFIFVIFNSSDPEQYPGYKWYLRKDIDGPEFVHDSSVSNLGDLKNKMSNVFAGANPRGSWYFRLAENENAGKSLEYIRDIELIIEYSL